MKAHSLRYKIMYLMKEYDQKWKNLIVAGTAKMEKKLGCLDGLIQEAIQ